MKVRFWITPRARTATSRPLSRSQVKDFKVNRRVDDSQKEKETGIGTFTLKPIPLTSVARASFCIRAVEDVRIPFKSTSFPRSGISRRPSRDQILRRILLPMLSMPPGTTNACVYLAPLNVRNDTHAYKLHPYFSQCNFIRECDLHSQSK